MTASRSPDKLGLYVKALIPVALIILGVLVSLYAIRSQLLDSKHKGSGVGLGQVIDDIKLTPIGAPQEAPLSALRAKLVLINFWATWCEACMSEMPSIVRLEQRFKSRGLAVVAINLDENPDNAAQKTAKKFKITFPLYRDQDDRLADYFNVHAIPRTVILDQNRKILYIRDGEADWDSPKMQTKVQEWLSG